jgi:hypothetical protein
MTTIIEAYSFVGNMSHGSQPDFTDFSTFFGVAAVRAVSERYKLTYFTHFSCASLPKKNEIK